MTIPPTLRHIKKVLNTPDKLIHLTFAECPVMPDILLGTEINKVNKALSLCRFKKFTSQCGRQTSRQYDVI